MTSWEGPGPWSQALSEWHASLVLESGLNLYQHNLSVNSHLRCKLMQRERRVSECKCCIFISLAEAVDFTRHISCCLLHCAALIKETVGVHSKLRKKSLQEHFSSVTECQHMLNFLPPVNNSPPSMFCFMTPAKWLLKKKITGN